MSRKPKRNKTKLEKLIKETWSDAKISNLALTEEQLSVIKAIKETLRHFEMEDYLYGSTHTEIFRKIYLSRRKPNKTKVAFAKNLFLGRNTLSNYTDRYIKCFEKNLNDTCC